MAISTSDNIHALVNRPLDFKFGPFIDFNQANSFIPISQRYHGLIFGVYANPGNIATSDIKFYYYWNGLSDTDIRELGKPPVDGTYVDQAAMIAAQSTQLAKYIYYDNASYWEYLGTTNGNISDYRRISFNIVGSTTNGNVLTIVGGVPTWQAPVNTSKWTDIGPDIYRNSRVLIGATTFSDSTSKFEVNGNALISGTVTINNTLSIRASATASAATQIPVFIADPTSTTRTLVTRTPTQLLNDIGAISGTGVNGQVTFWTGTNTIGSDSDFFWDSTLNRLTLGTSATSPFGSPILFMGNDQNGETNFQISNATSGTGASVGFRIFGHNGRSGIISEYSIANSITEFQGNLVIDANEPNSGIHSISLVVASANAGSVLKIYTGGRASTNKQATFFNNGNLLLQSGGTHTDAGFRLDVNGTARIQGATTIDGTLSLRASSGTTATHIPVFTADPSSVTRTLTTRTPDQLASDMGAVLTSGNQTILGIKTFQEIVLPTLSNNSNLKVGSLEFQSFGVNNSWFGDNLYFNGTAFQRRATGFGSLFYFAPGGEGQFRLYNTGIAGSTISGFLCQMKINFNGVFVAGGTGISEVANTYTGATFRADSNGCSIGLNGSSPVGRLDVRGLGTGTGITLLLEDSAGNNTFEFLDNGNLSIPSVNGAKIGTSTTQKIGFFNATPIIQPSGDILTALSNLGLVSSPTIDALYPIDSTSNTIDWTQPKTFGSISSPITGAITESNTNAKRVVQVIFYSGASFTTPSANWKLSANSAPYSATGVNIIYVEYFSDTYKRYWFDKDL